MALPERKQNEIPERAVDRTRNVKYTYTTSVKRNQAANDNYQAANDSPGRQTVDQSFREQSAERTLSGQPRNIERTMREQPQEEEQVAGSTARAGYSTARNVARKGTAAIRSRKKNKLKTTVRKTRAVRSSAMILSVGSIFAVVQFLIGAAYTMSFAVIGALDAATVQDEDGTFLAQLGSYIIDGAATALLAIAEIAGFSVDGMMSLMMGFSMLWTLITLMCAAAILSLNGYSAMSGRGAWAKWLSWPLVMITSVVPFLSMLPMTLAYVLVVFWKEK